MRSSEALPSLLLRDRFVVAAGLAGITALSWLYTYVVAESMTGGATARMPQMHPWTPPYLALVFSMWAVMMVAMMLPSASPLVLTFAKLNRSRREEIDPVLPTAVFVAGYLLVWTAYSAAATLAQWGLNHAALLSPSASSASPLLGGAILLAAGVFQWTPLKRACLSHCRSPLGFLLSEWRDGRRGALLMGLKHGVHCVGCCWLLMALLFVAGVMNVVWMAAVTGFVLVEKLLPRGETIARVSGTALIAAGLVLLFRG